MNSHKGHQPNSLQTAINKCVGIIFNNTVSFGQQQWQALWTNEWDLCTTHLYQILLDQCMDVYKFLMSSPKFDEAFLGTYQDIVDGKAPSSKKKINQQLPSKLKQANKPVGTDNAKTVIQAELLVTKVLLSFNYFCYFTDQNTVISNYYRNLRS